MSQGGAALERMYSLVKQAAEVKRELADAEERVDALNRRLHQLTHEELVSAMNEADCTSYTLQAFGNRPPLLLEMKPYYKANIPVSWPEAQRERAFSLVPDDLQKIVMTIQFGKGEATRANQLKDVLEERGYEVNMERSIAWGTLTAWVKRQVEEGRELPDLEKIGAIIGQVVTIKEQED